MRCGRLLGFLGVAWFLAGGAALAESPSQPTVDPSINAPFQNPDFDTWVQRFERPGREVYDRRQAIVAAVGLEPGMDVADIGAGTGLFTLLFADVVGPEGRVYAVDISDTFVRSIVRRASEKALRNVEGVVNDQHSANLPVESIDIAFIADTYHHFEHPRELMMSVYRALRPGGAVVIIDFRKDGSDGWVREHVRGDESAVVDEVEAVGFKLIEDLDLLKGNYFLRFRKPAAAGGERSSG